MTNIAYRQAYSEVLDILNHMKKEDIEKISPEFIEHLKLNASKNYVSRLDHTLRIKDMNLKPKTKAVLAIIYRKFWCDEEELKKFDEKLMNNELVYKEKLKEKINNFESEFTFPNKKEILISNSNENDKKLTPYKESIFIKFINKIKLFFWK